MAYVPIVLGIKPYYPRSPSYDIEVIYKSGDKVMRLDYLDSRPYKYNSAKRELDMHGLHWKAYQWREQDANTDWEYLK